MILRGHLCSYCLFCCHSPQRIAYKEGVTRATEAREEWSRDLPGSGLTIGATVGVRVEPSAGDACGVGSKMMRNTVDVSRVVKLAEVAGDRVSDEAVQALTGGAADALSCGPVNGSVCNSTTTLL